MIPALENLYRDTLAKSQQWKDVVKIGRTHGTAVGTGLNAPDGFAEKIAEKIAELTQKPFVTEL